MAHRAEAQARSGELFRSNMGMWVGSGSDGTLMRRAGGTVNATVEHQTEQDQAWHTASTRRFRLAQQKAQLEHELRSVRRATRAIQSLRRLKKDCELATLLRPAATPSPKRRAQWPHRNTKAPMEEDRPISAPAPAVSVGTDTGTSTGTARMDSLSTLSAAGSADHHTNTRPVSAASSSASHLSLMSMAVESPPASAALATPVVSPAVSPRHDHTQRLHPQGTPRVLYDSRPLEPTDLLVDRMAPRRTAESMERAHQSYASPNIHRTLPLIACDDRGRDRLLRAHQPFEAESRSQFQRVRQSNASWQLHRAHFAGSGPFAKYVSDCIIKDVPTFVRPKNCKHA